MAFADMKFPQAFWANMGLNVLFKPLGQTEEILPEIRRSVSQEPQQVVDQNLNKPPDRAVSPASKKEAAPAASGAVAKSQGRALKPIAPELWPLNWQKQLMRASGAKIAWSYWKLGEDLQKGKQATDQEALGRKQRGDLLRRFFTELAMPAGTHTFWPAALPDAKGSLTANPQVFWSGILELNCRGVVILGSQAARALLSEQGIRPLDELRMLGRMVWILRDPKALASNDSWFTLSVSLLRNAFRLYLR